MCIVQVFLSFSLALTATGQAVGCPPPFLIRPARARVRSFREQLNFGASNGGFKTPTIICQLSSGFLCVGCLQRFPYVDRRQDSSLLAGVRKSGGKHFIVHFFRPCQKPNYPVSWINISQKKRRSQQSVRVSECLGEAVGRCFKTMIDGKRT